MNSRRWLILAMIFIGLIAFAAIQNRGARDRRAHREMLKNLTHSASTNVHFIKKSESISDQGHKRELAVYLPPGYEHDTFHYPVIYFLDGQAIFDQKRFGNLEWQVDEVLDSLAQAGGPKAIAVGIYNSKKRDSEYQPDFTEDHSNEDQFTGHVHARWIATELKNWIDRRYRTLSDTKHTYIGGSSYGGIMAYYLLTQYDDVYGGALVMSPSCWVNEKIFSLHHDIADLSEKKIYLNSGEKETMKKMLENTRRLHQTILEARIPGDQIRMDIVPGKGHENMTWRAGVKTGLPWLLNQ